MLPRIYLHQRNVKRGNNMTDIKIGDHLLMHSRYSGDYILTVARETKTCWVAPHLGVDTLIRKDNGRIRGAGDFPVNSFDRVATNEDIEKLQREKALKIAVNYLYKMSYTDWESLGYDKLKLIIEDVT